MQHYNRRSILHLGVQVFKSGVDDVYMEQLKDFLTTLKAIDNLEPAEMSLALIPTNLTPIKDKRKPIVIDET